MTISREQWDVMKRHVEAAKSGGAKVLSNMSLVSQELDALKPSEPQTERFPGDPGIGNLAWGSTGPPGEYLFAPGSAVRQGCCRLYFQASGVEKYVSWATDIIETHSAVPICSFKPPGSWASVGAGDHDGWLQSLAEATSQIPGPVWLTLHHEPRNDGPQADYRAMYRRAYPILRQADNAAITPILNGWSFMAEDDPHLWIEDGSLDIVGVDVYPRKVYNAAELTAHYDRVWDTISTWGYPVLLAEWGARPSMQGDYAAPMIRDLYDYMLGHGVIGVSYFNSPMNIHTGTSESYVLDGDRLATFQECAELSTSKTL